MARKPSQSCYSAASTAPRTVSNTSQFKKDLKTAKRHQKCDLAELRKVMKAIEDREALDSKYRDHPLSGRYPDQKGGQTDCRECHVGNDWLLVYRFGSVAIRVEFPCPMRGGGPAGP